jgi:threonine/homoserine/homoserine lactone efflux protein
MDYGFFLKGMAIGFSIAAPVGPIGVLCIRRSLADGMRTGFAVGLGAATADAAYGCVAGFGLTAISGFLAAQQFWLGLVGGAFLCYLGVRTFLSKPAVQEAASRRGGLAASYISTLFLTLTNPATILSFVAIFAGLGLGASVERGAAAPLVSGVFIGSALWWLILSAGAGALRSRIDNGRMQLINRFSGCVLIAFGIYAVVFAIQSRHPPGGARSAGLFPSERHQESHQISKLLPG